MPPSESVPFDSPASHAYVSQRLRLHYVDWGNEDAPAMVLIHGGRDHARSWDGVAQAFRNDYHVIAPDLRGHGDSQWVIGSGYAMIDNVYDLAQLVHQQHLEPVTIIGHSRGGSIALQYAGVYPAKVEKLVAIEGLGPRRHEIQKTGHKPTPQRMAEWIEHTRALASRVPRRYALIEDAVQRMHEANARLSEYQARHLTIHGINQNEDGTLFLEVRPVYPRPLAPITPTRTRHASSGARSRVPPCWWAAANRGPAIPARTARPSCSPTPRSSSCPTPGTGCTTTNSMASWTRFAPFWRARPSAGSDRKIVPVFLARLRLYGMPEAEGRRRLCTDPPNPTMLTTMGIPTSAYASHVRERLNVHSTCARFRASCAGGLGARNLTHHARPLTRLAATFFERFDAGFQQAMSEYGIPIGRT